MGPSLFQQSPELFLLWSKIFKPPPWPQKQIFRHNSPIIQTVLKFQIFARYRQLYPTYKTLLKAIAPTLTSQNRVSPPIMFWSQQSIAQLPLMFPLHVITLIHWNIWVQLLGYKELSYTNMFFHVHHQFFHIQQFLVVTRNGKLHDRFDHTYICTWFSAHLA